jgi:cytochrome oxidase assembly protein ShyY1
LLVNRGWIPKNFLEQDIQYERPKGSIQIVGVPGGKGEQPRFMVPQHDFSKRPLRFYWMDKDVMEEMAGLDKGEAQLVVQVQDEAATPTKSQYPAPPPPGAVGEYKMKPLIHAGYAVTWFGLAGAGFVMTRKLITRGRA